MIPVVLQYQSGSAVNTSVIAQSCQGKQCAAAALERIFLEIFLNVIQQHIAGFGNTAADYEDLRVGNIGNQRHRLAQIPAKVLCDLDCYRISCFNRIPYVLCTQVVLAHYARTVILCQLTLCHTDNTRCGNIFLQASAVAAITRLRLIIIDMHMSNLACGSGCTGNHLTVDDNTAANTSSQGYYNDILIPLCAALPGFAQCCHVSVITSFYRHI